MFSSFWSLLEPILPFLLGSKEMQFLGFIFFVSLSCNQREYPMFFSKVVKIFLLGYSWAWINKGINIAVLRWKELWIFLKWWGCLWLSSVEGKKYNLWESVSFAAKLKKVKKKRRRDEELSSEESPRRHHHQTKVFAKFSHDAPPPGIKKKHLSIEQLNARRRKVWLSIVKKELPKVSNCLQYRQWQENFLCLLLKEEL